MGTILLYVAIILIGFFVAKKNFFPDKIKGKIGLLQTISLYILLGFMGYKIGSNDRILSNISQLGIQAILITIFSILFSVLLVFVIYRGGRK